jgi:hypothetical protein
VWRHCLEQHHAFTPPFFPNHFHTHSLHPTALHLESALDYLPCCPFWGQPRFPCWPSVRSSQPVLGYGHTIWLKGETNPWLW